MLGKLKGEIRSHLHNRSNQPPSNSSSTPTPATDVNSQSHTFSPYLAGINLSRLTFSTFYNPHHRQFCSPRNEPGTVDPQHGYVVWPVAIGFWAIADAAKRSRDPADFYNLTLAFEAMERHWNPDRRGYCAWLMFPGNNDIYYDDNAHCGNALVTAFEASNDRRYLDRARDIVTGILADGWDRSDNPGGIKWHVDNNDTRNACSTLSAAMLACRLALHGVERTFCTDMARAAIVFSEKHLIAQDDGLVIDAIHRDGDGWRVEAMKWTYNSGFGIEAFLLFAQLTGDASYHDKATRLALATVDGTCCLFDNTLPDPSQRIWWDSVFFAQHLVEALVLVAQAHGPGSAPATHITAYLARLAGHLRTYIVDAADGLYFRELRMYFVDEARTRWFNDMHGTQHTLTALPGDHEQGPQPVPERPLIKTLIGNAAVARIYLCTADLVRDVSLP